jgi:hypothetical protein
VRVADPHYSVGTSGAPIHPRRPLVIEDTSILRIEIDRRHEAGITFLAPRAN